MTYRLSQIKTVVPATQSAWVRLVVVDDLTWDDRVLPVLGYGVASTGQRWEVAGLYLVNLASGPTWILNGRSINGLILHSIGVEPVAGQPISGISDGRDLEALDDHSFFSFFDSITE